MRYVKKIAVWFMFVISGIALYIIIRNQPGPGERIDGDIADIHKSNKRIKKYLDTSASNIRSATKDNQQSLNLVSRLEANNEKFRQLLQEISKRTDN